MTVAFNAILQMILVFCCFCHTSMEMSALLWSDWDNGGVWQLALREVFEVQLFGREGGWICRAVVWMPPPAPDSLGGVLFPPRQPFIGSTGLLWSSKTLPEPRHDTLPPTLPLHPCPYPLPRGRKWPGGVRVAWYNYLLSTSLSTPWFPHNTSHDTSDTKTGSAVHLTPTWHRLTKLWARPKTLVV